MTFDEQTISPSGMNQTDSDRIPAEKVLIAYFSRAGLNYVKDSVINIPVGNTQVIAEMMGQLTGANVFRIEPTRPYPEDYNEVVALARAESLAHARPALKSMPEDMSIYDVIILGFPNWCATMPMAVFTFLESFDSTNKIILPFCTNEGSGFGHSLMDIAELAPKAHIARGLSILGYTVRASETFKQIMSWLRRNGIL